VITGFAVRVQLVPDVLDLSVVLEASATCALLATIIGASLRFDADRLAKLVVLGNLIGAGVGTVVLILGALGVFS
jgi:hypothetical protein